MFIVFVGLWTVGSIGVFFGTFPNFPDKGSLEPVTLELNYLLAKERGEKGSTDSFDFDREYKIELREYQIELREYHKERRNAIFYFFLYWLAPIGFVYGVGWTTGWIIMGFRKEK